ncbi:MAG: gas vesicle protein GvpN [Myxococcota bacterium]
MNTSTGETPVSTPIRVPKPAVGGPRERVDLQASEGFVCSAAIDGIVERAMTYLEIGYPLHLCGPAGTGKTTLAFHLAAQLGRPVMLLHGNADFKSADLIGNEHGYRKHRVVDNFIHSVVKTEEVMQSMWVDNQLTTACQRGYTLIYDEFTRSRPEANNILLSVLEEGILNIPGRRGPGQEGFVRVHPQFRAIFTSNPGEYAGTHKTQDALMDRMVTVAIDHYDRETEIAITMSRSGVTATDAAVIVDLARAMRPLGSSLHSPSIRACIIIARVLVRRGARAMTTDPVFRWVCHDVLSVDSNGQFHSAKIIDGVMDRVCGASTTQPSSRSTP